MLARFQLFDIEFSLVSQDIQFFPRQVQQFRIETAADRRKAPMAR
jgi:hypothetical protein